MAKGAEGVRVASPTSIEIDFRYRGARCKERLKLAPNSRNMEYAKRLRGTIVNEIAHGTFDYSKHFPNSKRVRRLSRFAGDSKTVAEGLCDWMARKRPELEHSTLIGHDRAVEFTLVPAFGATTLRAFKRLQLRTWEQVQSAGAKRMNNLLAPLRGMFADELDAGTIETNPIAGYKVRRPRQADKLDPIDPFTQAELTKILAECDGQLRNLFQFAAWTGLRISELIALQWRDVDLKGNLIQVRAAFVLKQRKSTKTSTGTRDVVLLRPAAEALRAQQAHTLLKGGAVFENPATDKPWMTDKQIRVWNWKRILKRAEVRYRYPGQLRHTFASTTLSAGENLFWVAKQMGHRDPTVTARTYARFIPSVLTDAGKKTEALWKA